MPIECADSPVTVIKDERSEDGTVGDGSEGTERRCYHCDGGDDHVDCRCRCSTEGERIASEAGTDIEEDGE
jgi:hypothetical protein